MKVEELKMHFEMFLIEHDAYTQFYDNVEEGELEKYLEHFPLSLISGMFTWDETPEGYVYWRKLSDAWRGLWGKLNDY